MAKDPGDKLKNALKFNISNSPRGFSNQIGGSDRLDLIRVTLNQRSTLNVTMTKLKADANLRLLDSKGKKSLAQSRLRGKQNESIVTPLDAGTYYIEVKPGSVRDSTRYQLTLSAGNTAPQLTNVSLSSRAGATTLITNSALKATDSEQQSRELVYTLTSLPQGGKVQLNGVALGLGGRFTQADIDDGRLNYAGSGSITRLTDNSTTDTVVRASGANIIWNSLEGQQLVKSYFYNGQANTTVELTSPGVTNSVATSISESNAVWLGYSGTTNDVFLYQEATRSSTKLTNNNLIEESPFIFGSNIGWNSIDGQVYRAFFYDNKTGQTRELTSPGISSAYVLRATSDSYVGWLGFNGTTNEVFLFDIATGKSTQLTSNTVNEIALGVSETYANWGILEGEIRRSFFYNIQTGQTTEVTSPGITNVTVNRISGSKLAWTGFDGNDTEVFLFDGITGTSTQLTNNNTNDSATDLSGSNVVWTGFDGADTDIFFYNGTTKMQTQLTNNDVNDVNAFVSGSNVSWSSFDGTDFEIFSRRFASSDNFSFTVVDGSGGVTNGTLNLTIT